IHTHLYFSYVCADHRDTHSFPTRRSSDLERHSPGHERAEALSGGTLEMNADGVFGQAFRSVAAGQFAANHGADDAMDVADGQRRSEEHTSELQSRENLVCRLLLEKKKEQH